MSTSRINATIGGKLLRNAARFFDASVDSVVAEAVQNARRAGATEVRFTLRGRDLEIADDGRGLASADAPVLLSLGGSANDARTEAAEDTAGIGFFSLGNHCVEVWSRDWRMWVPREAFTGEASATIETGRPETRGMRIVVQNFVSEKHDGSKSAPRIAVAARRATVYGGLACTLVDMPEAPRWELSGEDPLRGAHPNRFKTTPLQRFEPEDFLSAYDDRAIAAAVVEIPGATAKIVRYAGRDLHSKVNFFGQVVSGNGPARTQDPFAGALGLPEAEGVGYVDNGRIAEKEVRFVVLVDVSAIGTLKLKLPDRNSLIDDDGLATLRSALRKGVQDMLRRPGLANGLAVDHPLRSDAPDIRPGDRVMRSDENGNEEGEQRYGERDLLATCDANGRRAVVDRFGAAVDPGSVVAGDMSDAMHAILATTPEGSKICVHRPDDVEAALGPDHDTVVAQSFVVRVGDEEIEGEPSRFDPEDMPEGFMPELAAICAETGANGCLARDIHAKLHVFRPGTAGARVWRTVPVSTLFWDDSNSGCKGENTVVAAQGTPDSVVVGALLAGTDWYREDVENGPYDDQRDEWYETFSTMVAEITGGSEALLLQRMREAMDAFASEYLRRKGAVSATVSFTFDAGDGFAATSIAVDAVVASGAAASAAPGLGAAKPA